MFLRFGGAGLGAIQWNPTHFSRGSHRLSSFDVPFGGFRQKTEQRRGQIEVTGVGTQESGVAGVAEYASKVSVRKSTTSISLARKIFAKLPDSLAPELLQLLTPEFRNVLGGQAHGRRSLNHPGWKPRLHCSPQFRATPQKMAPSQIRSAK